VDNHPEIIFKSTKIEGEGTEYTITGELTMKGVTKEISIPCTIAGPITSPFGTEVIGISGELSVNRQDDGITWNKILDEGGYVVSDEIRVIINIEANKQK